MMLRSMEGSSCNLLLPFQRPLDVFDMNDNNEKCWRLNEKSPLFIKLSII